jgi:hypothetical protein
MKGTIQTNVIHMLSYCINFSLLYLLYNYTNLMPSFIFITYYILLICFDIYALFNMNVIYYISTQSLLFLSVLFYYYRLLPKNIKKSIYSIIGWISLIIFLLLNERYNCEKMLSIYLYFPYHIFNRNTWSNTIIYYM